MVQSSSNTPATLAERLAAMRRGRFIGRENEIALFRSALHASEPPFAVLHIYGPGGVGKTSLLREYERLATEFGRPTIRLDGRNLNPSPPEFWHALRLALGKTAADKSDLLAQWPANSVLIIDTYETVEVLDGWLRDAFLPHLPAQSLVIVAGRNQPALPWRTDLDWGNLTRIISLRNLQPEESLTFLTTRGIPSERHNDVLAFTHGHPLALSLIADVFSQRQEKEAAFLLKNDLDIVHVLLTRFVQDIPTAVHRRALECCAIVWATTETLLAEVVDKEQAAELFAWLRGLSFIEHGPYGLFPHDLVRDMLTADLRWRDRELYRELIGHIADYLYALFDQVQGIDQQRIRTEIMFLRRHNPAMKQFFDWSAMGSMYAEAAVPADYEALVAMVQHHEGAEAAALVRHWWTRQPHGFLAYRTLQGELRGFMATLLLEEVSAEDEALDPAVCRALAFIREHGGLRPGAKYSYLRFWMERDKYQAVSPALNLTAINSTIYWLNNPQLAWSFLVMANPEFMEPHFIGIRFKRLAELDFEIGGRRFGIFGHDWQIESPQEWQQKHAENMGSYSSPTQPHKEMAAPTLLVLSQVEFEGAVKQALRDYTRPDLLASNPLLRSQVVIDAAAAGEASPATLQALLKEAAALLTHNPKDQKLHRALWHTYFEPAPTQENAAELLDLPFSTYRYHLTNGIQRIVEWLWQREMG